jgi:hypothetical protein
MWGRRPVEAALIDKLQPLLGSLCLNFETDPLFRGRSAAFFVSVALLFCVCRCFLCSLCPEAAEAAAVGDDVF